MFIFDKNKPEDLQNIKNIAEEEGAFLLIDKSYDWSSNDVIGKLKYLLNIKKIGHSGTLDPYATGLLIVALGKATKQLTALIEYGKAYSGHIKFGVTTKTDDAEADEENPRNTEHLTQDVIQSEANKFLGKINQFPPKYSAKKIGGQRMYNLVRKGIEFEVKASEVEIKSFDILNYKNNISEFYCEVSKGTYIRSLARDLGEILNCGAYLFSLRREKIGNFEVTNAITIDELIKLKNEYIS